MAFNQVVSFHHGYVVSAGQTGSNIAGLYGLLLKGSVNATGVCIDPSGNIYVTDVSRHIVLKITQNDAISVIGGLAGASGSNTDQTVTAAASRFNSPRGICCDRNGDLYICDTGNNQIRKISNNKVSLVAGAANGASGTADGVGSAARFNRPYDIDIDSAGNLFVADTYNHAVRRIKGGVVQNFAGLRGTSGNLPLWADMTTAVGISGVNTRFTRPESIAVDYNGYIYVGDTGNYCIKRIDQAGNVRVYSGDSTFGRSLGTSPLYAKTCKYQYLRFSDVDKSGNLFIIDYNEGGPSRLVRIDREGRPGNVLDWNGLDNGQYVVSVAVDHMNKLVIIESEYNKLEFSSSSSSSTSSSSHSSESIGNTSSSESSVSSRSSSSSSSNSSSSSSETEANVSTSSSTSRSSSSSS